MFKDLFGLEDAGEFEVVVLAERIGPDAEPIIDFLDNEAFNYPCRNAFIYVPGPNCHTFTQWALLESGWGVVLPVGAFGRNYAPHCQTPGSG